MEDKGEFDNDELENEAEFMSLADLAKNMRMDRSHARRWIIKLGYTFHK
jgi:hypothetical protein